MERELRGLAVAACVPLPAPAGHGHNTRVNLASFPPGAGATVWDRVDPEVADLIVVPWLPNAPRRDPAAVQPAFEALLERLPHYRAYPWKHVLLDNSDLDVLDRVPAGHLFKSSAGPSTKAHVLHYSVADPGPPAPVDEARYDACFHGALTTHPLRDGLSRWRYGWNDWTVTFKVSEPFWTLNTARQAQLRLSHSAAMRASRFVLCPRGRGLNSRRFFEALAHARVPILYSDAARLPLARRIPWDRVVIRVPEGFGGFTPHFVERFLDANNLAESSALARRVWEDYFAPERLRAFVVATLRDAGRVG